MKMIEKLPNGRKRVYTVNKEPSRTDPQFKDECDVNYIMKKFGKTGQISHLAKRAGMFADVSEIPDLAEALTTVNHAQETFETIPANLRKRFGNSPINFVEFLKDPSNDEEAIRLGLKVRRKIDQEDQKPKVKAKKTATKVKDEPSNEE